VSRFSELKAKAAEAWSSAPWEQAAQMLAGVHLHLLSRLEPQPGERWLDLATGTGDVAFLAARAGAETTGIDFARASIETARRTAAEKGLDVHFEVADVEELPFEDASFDVLSSSMGMIFTPDHEAVAREVARVCRPGGRLGFTAWKPETGFTPVAQKYRPPPEPGAGDSDDWSREDYARALLDDSFELELEDVDFRFPAEPGEALWERVTSFVGPLKATAAALDPADRERFHRDFIDYVDGFGDDGVPGDYLLVLGKRR
jgi:SAM-dependent methyltransferase